MPAGRHPPPRRAPPIHDRGFTILEMLIVLAIVGMAMAVVPSILAGLDNSRLRAAALDLIGDLRLARGQAARAEGSTELAIDLDRLGFTLSDAQGFHPLPPVVGEVQVVPPALVGADRIARIRFLPDGSATAARIVLRRGSLSATIVVDGLTGRVWRDG